MKQNAIAVLKAFVLVGLITGAIGASIADAAAPGRVTLLAPSSVTTTNMPAFSWLAVPDATYYLIRVTDWTGASVERWHTPATAGCPLGSGVCSASLGAPLPPGPSTWKMLAWSPAGYGPWSDVGAFSIEIGDPLAAAPQPIAPTGTVSSYTATYTWTPVSSAVLYRLWISHGGPATQSWYTPAALGCVGAAAPCGIELTALANGTAQWKVQAWTMAGHSDWSASLTVSFTGPPITSIPGRVTRAAPAGPVTTRTPTFTWSATPNVSYYLLRVIDWTGTSVDRWYTPAIAGCPLGSGVCSASLGAPLPPGPATWQVLAWNPIGYGPWSDIGAFSVEIPDPLAAAPQPIAPSGTLLTYAATYTWTPVPGAVQYRLWISHNGGPASESWRTPAALGCVGAATPCGIGLTALANGTAEWKVQAWTVSGHSSWSTSLFVSFAVFPAPLRPSGIAPSGPSGPSPTFTWAASANVIYYYLKVDDVTGTRVNQWLTPAQAGCASGGGACAFTPAVVLNTGAARWQVIAWNPSGYSQWSSLLLFTPDGALPTVAVSSPLGGSTVQTTIIITANASDNVGVVGVQFKLDGVNLGLEDTTAPYSTSWNTTETSNGSHVLTAWARDTSNNVAASNPIAVTVANAGGQIGFQNEILVTGLDFPTSLEFLPDGGMIVGELSGTIKLVLPGQTQAEATPFLRITNIGSAGGLQGLFDIELDPNFATNRYFYVFYTLGSPNRDRLARFTMDPTGRTASLASQALIWQDPLTAGTDHHGGAVVFGNDGKLYVTTGDHFTGSATAQQLTSHRGKVLRFNPDGTVPTDNPFHDGAGSNYDAIWAVGFRNPFRMTIDRPTGRIFVADVGGNSYESAREEINILTRGANYHWPNCEGVCGAPGNPVYDYSHYVSGGSGPTRDASVTGGFVYRGSQFPAEYVGNYFFGDYTQNWIRRLTFDQSGGFTGMQFFEPVDGRLDAPIGAVVHMVEGPDGALYYTDIGWENETEITGGKIRRIRYNAGNQSPIAAAAGGPLQGAAPLTVNFSSAGSYDPENQPLTYLWTFGDGTSSTQPNPQHVYTRNGEFTVRLQVSDGSLGTLSDPIPIQVGHVPQVTILTPTNGTFFRAGDVIGFSGQATDVEDGVLPASAFSWQVLFHHNTHVHPALPLNGATSGAYNIGTSGHDYSGTTSYEIVLTVTDSDGLRSATSVFVHPQKINLTFNTSPAGLSIEIDGVSHATPFVYDTLIGFTHTINAPHSVQGPNINTFVSWSDAGAQQHNILAPTTEQFYTATYAVTQNSALVAAYNFNIGSGTTLPDISGNGRDGSLKNAPTWTAGKYGFGLSFDGANDHVVIGDLNLTGSFTISFWATADNLGSGCHGSAVMKRHDYGFEICGQMFGRIGKGVGPGWAASTSYTIPQTGVWKYYALTYDGATARLYVDGVQVSTASGAHITNNNNLMIGTWDTASEFYDGTIDELRIYGRALTQPEIQSDMNSPL